MWFLIENEVFIVGFTVLFLVVDEKVKIHFLAFDFPFEVCGGWRKSSSFVIFYKGYNTSKVFLFVICVVAGKKKKSLF